MTNYNERLDEVIAKASAGIGGFGKLDNGKFYKGISEIEAKQAIISLIKELVKEAKPKTMPSNLPPKNYERCEQVVNQYHHNLLKALEEV